MNYRHTQKLDANQPAELKRSSLLIAHILHGARGILSLCNRMSDCEWTDRTVHESRDPCPIDTVSSSCQQRRHLENGTGALHPAVHCTPRR